jgi:multiple sugar transport system permease protein
MASRWAATAAGRRLGRKISAHLLLVPFLIFALFPFYHMTLTSLKQDKELYDRTAVPLLIRQGPTLTHYTKLLWETEFLTWTKNSLLVTFLATALSLTIGTVAAYALARLQFFGVGGFGTAIFVTYLVPTSLLFLPLAQVVNWLGLADSKWALVVTYPTFLVPFCTWLLMGYFRTVPKEVEECAMVDGATRLQALWPQLEVLRSDDLGIPADAKEAIGFAILANETFNLHAGNIPSATGARHPTVLGKVTYGNNYKRHFQK